MEHILEHLCIVVSNNLCNITMSHDLCHMSYVTSLIIMKNAHISIWSKNCHFLMKNHKNYNQGEFSDFHDAPYIWFSQFPWKWLFSWKMEKSYIGWICENPRMHPSYHIRDFPSKLTIFTLKWQFLNFSEFSLALPHELCHELDNYEKWANSACENCEF